MKVHEVDVHPALPERIAWLDEIARNVWSSWSPEAGDLFERLDPEGWERLGHNPVALLRGLPQEALDAAAADESFVAMVARVARRLDAYVSDTGWLVPAHPEAADMLVAYFSLEFGLDAGIPLYSGGLGILAGDHLKSASDLGVPLVGVGLLYRSGYFHQALGPDGGQRERYPATDWSDLPLRDQVDADGDTVVVEVEIGDETVRAAVRTIQVGRVTLLLLDADIEGNSEDARHITDVLYGGDRDHRIHQEILLGVGGVRALAASGLSPTVFHMNEGHSALLVLERMRALIADGGLDLGEAREQVVASTVFTTHTPVPAGNEIFDPELARPLPGAHGGRAGHDLGRPRRAGRLPGGGQHRLRHDPARPAHLGLRQRRRGPPRRHLAPHVAGPVARSCRSTRCRSRASPTASTPPQLAQPRDARAARPLHRPRAARAPRGPGRLGEGRHHPGRRAVARARAAPRAPGPVRPGAPAPPAQPPGLAPHRQPRRRRRPAARTRSRSASRGASPPTSGPTCSSATRTAWRACSATSGARCR